MYTNCFLLYFTIEYYIHACVFNVKSGKIKKSLKPELINNDITFNCVSEANKKKRKNTAAVFLMSKVAVTKFF